ncbi:glycine oxidase ThiO [Bacillus sp. BRMEA1]|uniref:glycine oxidase ThiO n=1 Tax=Neobacillus endophyticus TaxID=2738405 RepID=UPI0015631FD7|nr:glycine oxidase ThiO [Neobacillus endophyticus]NRD80682.1 glycine oxidase ThiO [Neobacillus endophyticus]
MNHSFDVAIIGGGINGASIAYQLSKIGKKVAIIEKERIGSEASSAAAGMLAAQAEIEHDGPLFQLALKSQAMFPDISNELFEYTGIDIEYVHKGMLKIAETEELAHELKKQVNFQKQWDHEIRWLDTKELLDMEPALSPSVFGAIYLPNDGHVKASKLTDAFAKAALYFGAEIRENTKALSFIYENGKIAGLNTNNGTISCGQVVVATGAWASELLKNTGIDIPIYPVKGECFSVRTEEPLINTTIFSDKRCYLVPKRNGEIFIGATMVENTFEKKVTAGGISGLIDRACQLVPQIKDAEWERVWSGIRPQTSDGLPYIGAHPLCQGLFIAAGHFRNGILLSPITGKLVVELLENQVSNDSLLTAFRLDRSMEIIQ